MRSELFGRFRQKMKKLIRELTILGMIGVITASAVGQGKSNDKQRPPKQPEKVVSPDKRQPPPPPQNTNRPRPDNKKKP
jgi:hypothetical protein